MKAIEWTTVKNFEDITYKKANGVARIAFNRPEVRNAFRPKTVTELLQASVAIQRRVIMVGQLPFVLPV